MCRFHCFNDWKNFMKLAGGGEMEKIKEKEEEILDLCRASRRRLVS